MFWLFKSFFLYSNKFNFLFHNFYFLKNFNSLFYFDVKHKTPLKFENNFEYKFNRNDFLKLTKHINLLVKANYSLLVNRNFLQKIGKINKIKLYSLKPLSVKIYKSFLNSIYQLSLNNLGFVVIDDTYKTLLPLYNYIYSEKNLMIYKNFFFVKKNYFTYYNWIYFYKSFIKKFGVSIIIVFDYYSYKYFYKYLLRINLPIACLIPVDCHSDFVDYPLFFHDCILEKHLVLNLISSIYFLAINYNSYYYKKKYISLFYDFQKNRKL